MSTEFHGYEKMPDNFKKLATDPEQFRKLNKMKWVVTEKVHGANFSFVLADGEVRYAKRKELLEWSDDFFGYQTMVRKIEAHVLRLFNALQQRYTFQKATLYGELFGGAYPHPEVTPISNVQAIQTGVYYAPSIEFCAFDIALENGSDRYYLDYEDALTYFETAGILHAKALHVGTLEEAMNFPTEFSSPVPAHLGLPALPGRNVVEGIVIKPFRHNEILGNKEARPVLKNQEQRVS